jgi:hypothetical protein
MKIAHVIITYTSPVQTKRMIERMMHPDMDFYIHLDKKFALETHSALFNMPNVYFVKERVDVSWAGFSTTQAIINSCKDVLQSGKKYDYINVLSGQDYPIKTPEQIVDFYKANVGYNFTKYEDFQGDWKEGMLRINRYHMTNFKFKGRYVVERFLNTFLPKRKIPNLKFYGISMFWSFHPDCVAYVLNELDKNPKLKRFFKLSWAPDEFMFQTLLLNSSFANTIKNWNAHFYLHKPNEPHPKFLMIEDFDVIKNSDKLYARKFKEEIDIQILNKIDSEILGLNNN